MASLRLHRTSDPDEFERFAFPFLAAHEAEHNLLFGIVAGVRSGSTTREPYFAVVRDSERVVAAALRTPPYNLVLSTIDDAGALALFADDAAARWPDLRGVLGAPDDARAFVALWRERTGQAARLHMSERVFRLTRVVPPRPVAGRMRLAESRDRELTAEWAVAFAREALREEDPDRAQALTFADRMIAGVGSAYLYVWEDGGAVVSHTGARAVTPNGSRIGPVYTPPELRGRGYASALVAGASQDQLDRGRRYCFLFTDLANPTSNHIYRAIGYEPVCDVDDHRFTTIP